MTIIPASFFQPGTRPAQELLMRAIAKIHELMAAASSF
jgi:hypothetical protein